MERQAKIKREVDRTETARKTDRQTGIDKDTDTDTSTRTHTPHAHASTDIPT